MNRLSSNFTLFYKMFIPIIYFTFIGAIAFVVAFVNIEENAIFGSWTVKFIFLTFFVLMLLLMWFTIADLKRVELEGEYLYVTNYFNTYRYHISGVEKIKTYELGIFEVISLHMKTRTKMGKKIRFLSESSEVGSVLQHLLDTTMPSDVA